MTKNNSKLKNALLVLGVSTVIAGASTQANVVLADTSSDTTSSVTTSASTSSTNPYEQAEKDEQVNETKQAYQYPVEAAELTIKQGQDLPEAQEGVANWSSLPAGTTAVWYKEPEVDQVGRTFGTVIVTFPDQSASIIAVYVNVEGEGKSTRDVSATDVQKAVAAAAKDAAANQKDVATSNSANNSSANTDTNSQVVVKDVKTEYNTSSQKPTKKSQATDNAVAKSNPGEAELPQTQGKNSSIAIISGVLLAIVGFGVAIINKFRTEK